VQVRQKEYDAALAEAKRAELLIDNKAISEKAFEAIMAVLAKAEASLNAARAKYNLFTGTYNDSVPDFLSTFSLVAPLSGVIQDLSVTYQQIVSSSAPLFDISPVRYFWIKVPVYSGTTEDLDRDADVSVSTMGTGQERTLYTASPVKGPLTGDVTTATSYLYYVIKNDFGTLRNGQKVSVTLNMKSEQESIEVPYSAIVYDMYGGTWLYIKAGAQIYVRQRVELDHITGDKAILNKGIKPGDEVVFKGSAELFGTEFGGVK
jgi:cobalt-zinc-cadmium efflux system membrane fusion protein